MNLEKPRLFAFDVNSHFARVFKVKAPDNKMPTHAQAFHLGEPVFCLKPLLRMIEKEMDAVRDLGYGNSHVVMVFDPPGKNFRHELYPDYKGNRPPKPDEWRRQEQLMYEMFQSLGYPCLRIDGFEADDVLGTLAQKLSAHGIDVILFTGDKDIMSCCDPQVSVYAGREKKLLTMADVQTRFGVPASKVIDFLAMKGDSADNVDGILGVGDKKAVQILSQFTFEEVVEEPTCLHSLSLQGGKKIVAWLQENKQAALLSKQLVSLRTDVPLGINFKEMVRKAPDHASFLNGFMAPTM